MTKLALLNYVLQFLFIRIYKTIVIKNKRKYFAYGIAYFIMPLTGWTTNFKGVGKIKWGERFIFIKL